MSNAFQLYFTILPKTLFNLNLSFQEIIPLIIQKAVVQAFTRFGKLVKKVNFEKNIYVLLYSSICT